MNQKPKTLKTRRRRGQRVALGIASAPWELPALPGSCQHSLGVADWVTCAEELFDDYLPPSEHKIEPRPKQPLDMLRWAKQARNGVKVACLMYGAEHEEEREEAAASLHATQGAGVAPIKLLRVPLKLWRHAGHLGAPHRNSNKRFKFTF